MSHFWGLVYELVLGVVHEELVVEGVLALLVGCFEGLGVLLLGEGHQEKLILEGVILLVV